MSQAKEQTAPDFTDTAVNAMPQKKTLKRLMLSAVALILVVGIIAGFQSNWFGFYGPGTKLLLSARKTLCAESYTAEFEFQVGSYQSKPFELQAQIDDGEITLLGHYSGQSVIYFGIYQGYWIQRTGFGKYTAKDISAQLEAFRSGSSIKSEADWREILQTLSQTLYEEYGNKLNYSQINPAFLSLFRKLNSPDWLNSTAGLTTEKDGSSIHYCLRPNIPDFTATVLSCFENVFHEEEDYRALHSLLTQNSAALKDSDFELQCNVNNGYLNEAVATAMWKDVSLWASLHFTKVNETEINLQELADILSRASIE